MARSRTMLLAMAAAVLFACSAAHAEEEEITITTYYPSPYGNYNQLNTNSLMFLPRAKEAPACSKKNEGTVYYRKDDHRLYLCNGMEWRGVGAGGFTEVKDYSMSSSENKVFPLGEWDVCFLTGVTSNAGGGFNHGCRVGMDQGGWSLGVGANGKATVQCDVRCGNF